MEIIKVGIYLEDSEFAQRLAEGISREYRGFHIHLLDNLDHIESCDLVISSSASTEKKVIQACTHDVECEDEFWINIYKDCPNLINDLLYIYFRLTGKVCSYKGEASCRKIFFCSADGGEHCTELALNVGKTLERVYGKRSIYINLCSVDASHNYVTHEESGLLKIMYYLNKSVDFPVSHFITEECAPDCLNTGIINSYADEMNEELFKKFFERIEELGRYSYAIIDVGNNLSRTNRKLISDSDYAVLAEGKGKAGIRAAVCSEITRLKNSENLIIITSQEEAYGHVAADISKKIVEDCENEPEVQ